jgi:hypothetical protein
MTLAIWWLGWETSIFACNNGTVNTPNDAISGDCKLDAEPQYNGLIIG